MAFNDMKTAVLNVLRKHLLKEFLLEKKMWSNQKKKKKKIHVFTVLTILTLQFMFLMALRQNPITAIHRVPKRKNTQLIILLRIQWHFCSKKRTKKKNSNFYVSELRLVALIMLYLKPWRVLFGDLAPSTGVCVHH